MGNNATTKKQERINSIQKIILTAYYYYYTIGPWSICNKETIQSIYDSVDVMIYLLKYCYKI